MLIVGECVTMTEPARAGAVLVDGERIVGVGDRDGLRARRPGVREVRVAMVADIGTLQRLSRIVGEGHARELCLTGKDIDAERALRIGLINEVCETKEAAWDAARAMARPSPIE